MSFEIIHHPSKNYDERGDGPVPVDSLVLHYTGMRNGPDALARLSGNNPKGYEGEVSAHYMIEEDGRIFALVPEEKRAWHAGQSYWAGHRNLNARSIGIELVNPGHDHGYRIFPEAQIAALIALCHDILGRHNIPQHHILGHSDIAPARRADPGELFPWEKLAAAGVGLWPGAAECEGGVEDVFKSLCAFGYDPECNEKELIVAFQRHFEPEAFAEGRVGLMGPSGLARLNFLQKRAFSV